MDADCVDRSEGRKDGQRGDSHLPLGTISRAVIGSFFDVYNELGPGFLESVYQSALVVALGSRGFSVEREFSIDVRFRGESVGTFRADLIVARAVLVEVKAGKCLVEAHAAQVVNYLRATSLRVGLLLNFGARPEFRRLVHTPEIRVHPR